MLQIAIGEFVNKHRSEARLDNKTFKIVNLLNLPFITRIKKARVKGKESFHDFMKVCFGGIKKQKV